MNTIWLFDTYKSSHHKWHWFVVENQVIQSVFWGVYFCGIHLLIYQNQWNKKGSNEMQDGIYWKKINYLWFMNKIWTKFNRILKYLGLTIIRCNKASRSDNWCQYQDCHKTSLFPTKSITQFTTQNGTKNICNNLNGAQQPNQTLLITDQIKVCCQCLIKIGIVINVFVAWWNFVMIKQSRITRLISSIVMYCIHGTTIKLFMFT